MMNAKESELEKQSQLQRRQGNEDTQGNTRRDVGI